MHFAFIAETLPNPSATGAGCHLWSMTQYATEAHHRVTYIVVGRPYDLHILAESEVTRLCEQLKRMGVTLLRQDVPLAHDSMARCPHPPRLTRRWRGPLRKGKRALVRLARALMPTFADYDRYFDVTTVGRNLRQTIEALGVDAVFVFAWGPIAAVRDFRSVPRMALPGDLTHLVVRERLRHRVVTRGRDLVQAVEEMIMLRRLPEWVVYNLSGLESVAWSAAQHAAWLRSRGVPCQYIPTSAPDQVGPDCEERRALFAPNLKPKLVHLGHLGGTAALAGIRLLSREVLPILERELGPDGFEMRFVGRQDMGPEIAHMLDRPSVHLTGHLEDLTEEMLASDIFIVPSPVRYGMRTRVVTGLSFGCCVVAHETCALGNPELVHGRNVLLGADGTAIARCILRALGDPGLRQTLRQNARRTYERFFAPHVASARYIAELERIASDRRAREKNQAKLVGHASEEAARFT